MNGFSACYRYEAIPTNLLVKELVFNYLGSLDVDSYLTNTIIKAAKEATDRANTAAERVENTDVSILQSDLEAQKLDTGITATAKFGGVERTQSDVNSDIVSIKNFPTLAAAQAYATDNNVKVFIPTGEHTYDLSNADMTLFWGYGQLKDSSTGDIYTPKNGDFVTPEMFGIREKVDETVKLKAMIEYAAINNISVVFSGGKEYWHKDMYIMGENLSFKWGVDGSGVVIRSIDNAIPTDWNEGNSIHLSGVVSDWISVTSNVALYSDTITVADASGIEAGDLILVQTTRLVESENRGQAYEGQFCKCVKVTGNNVTLLDPMRLSMVANKVVTATISAKNTDSEYVVSGLNIPTREALVLLDFTSGAASGTQRKVTYWNNTTKVLKFEGRQSGVSNTAVGDKFTLTRKTQIKVIKPCKVNISGDINFTRTEVITSDNTQALNRGLRVSGADKPKITGVNFTNFGESGVCYDMCYKGYVDVDVYGANRVSTGYGITITHNYNTTALGNFSKCRRGIDVGGSSCFSYDTVMSGVVTSVSHDSSGAAFFPVGTSQCEGFGSHGTGHSTVYKDIKVINCKSTVHMRGMEETIVNGTHIGACGAPVVMQGGGGLIIDGFRYIESSSAIANLEDSYHVNVVTRPSAFLSIIGTEYLRTLPIVIKNTESRCLDRAFVYFVHDNVVPPLQLADNSMYIKGRTDGQFNIVTVASTGGTLTRFEDLGGNTVIDVDGVYYKAERISDRVVVAEKLLAYGTTHRTVNIPAKSTVKIKMGLFSEGIILTVVPVKAGRTQYLNRAILYQNQNVDLNPNAANNKYRFTISTTAIEGDAAPHLSFTVAYSVGNDGYLRIANGTTRDEVMFIEYTEL